MDARDEFAGSLIEESKRFLEIAKEQPDDSGRHAYLHAALLVGFCGLEAHLNSIVDQFVERWPDLTAHERGVLLEREVRLDSKGEYQVTATLKMTKLEERIPFIHKRFSGKSIDKSAAWWSDLQVAMKHRNDLVHPRESHVITIDSTTRALQSIVDAIDVLYQALFNNPFPLARHGLQSTLRF